MDNQRSTARSYFFSILWSNLSNLLFNYWLCSILTPLHLSKYSCFELQQLADNPFYFLNWTLHFKLYILWSFRFSSGSVSVCTRRISIVVYNYFGSSNNRNLGRAYTYTSTWKSETPNCLRKQSTVLEAYHAQLKEEISDYEFLV